MRQRRRLLLIASVFLLWRLPRPPGLPGKNLRVRPPRPLASRRPPLLLLCVLPAVPRSSRRLRAPLGSWLLLIDFLSPRRFRVPRRVPLLICFLRPRRFLIPRPRRFLAPRFPLVRLWATPADPPLCVGPASSPIIAFRGPSKGGPAPLPTPQLV